MVLVAFIVVGDEAPTVADLGATGSVTVVQIRENFVGDLGRYEGENIVERCRAEGMGDVQVGGLVARVLCEYVLCHGFFTQRGRVMVRVGSG